MAITGRKPIEIFGSYIVERAIPGSDLEIGTVFRLSIDESDSIYKVEKVTDFIESPCSACGLYEKCGCDGFTATISVPRCMIKERKDGNSVYFRKLN